MARMCPSCNKFCGIEQGEPEMDDAEVDKEDGTDAGQVAVTGRLILLSTCCGEEVASANVDVQMDFTHKCPVEKITATLTADLTDRMEGKGRGMRTFYGAEVTAEVVCECGWTEMLTETVEEQASYFEEG